MIPSPSALAVIFFFVLSGTVMGMAHPAGKPSPRAGGDFFLRRALRIYPLYWLATAAAILNWPQFYHPDEIVNWILLTPQTGPDGAPVLRDMLPPAWTLHWEIFFYLMFGLCLVLPWRRWIFGIWLFAILLFNSVLKLPPMPGWLTQAAFVLISPLGLFFLGGIAVAAVAARGRLGVRMAWGLLAGSLVAMAYCLWCSYYGLFLPADLLDFGITALAMAGLVAALMNLEAHGKLPVGQWCLTLGKCSYPVYITHWLFLGLTFRVFGANNIDMSRHYLEFAVAGLVVSLAGGVCVTYGLDGPMQKLFKRLLPVRGVG